MKTTCSKCDKPLPADRLGKARYCRECATEYVRKNRGPRKEMDPEERKRQNARAYLHVYVKRGKVTKLPCRVCGDANSEAHHDDYSKPLEVVWLCRKHHMEFHGTEKAA